MTRRSRRRPGIARAEDGAVAIEFAIIALVFIFVCLATIEFGRALYVRNELSFAADIAAREILKDSAATQSTVATAARAAFSGNDDKLTVQLNNETVDGIEFRTLRLSYPFTMLIPQFGKNFSFNVSRRTPAN